jgi:hypothetical protein
MFQKLRKQMRVKSEVYFTADAASESAIDLPCVLVVYVCLIFNVIKSLENIAVSIKNDRTCEIFFRDMLLYQGF